MYVFLLSEYFFELSAAKKVGRRKYFFFRRHGGFQRSNKLPHSVGYLHEKNNLIGQVVVNLVATSL